MLYLTVGLILLSVLIYYKIIKPSKYWQERDVVHVKSWPLIGSMRDFVFRKKHILDVTLDLYKKFPNERCVGFMQFTSPVLMIRDLELIKQIGVKDFDHFHDHLASTNSQSDSLLSKSLISLCGEDWRQMRATLSPVFTSKKMRNMYQLMEECARDFVGHLHDEGKDAVDMKDIFSRFATDVIATTAFGIKINSLTEPNNEFFKMGNSFTNIGIVQGLKLFILQLAPSLAKLLRMQLIPKNVSTFFRSVIKDNINKRESEEIVRPDLIHLLMEARKGQLQHDLIKDEKEESFATVEESHIGKNPSHMKLTDDIIISQALTFFLAGFDTVSTASCFMAHELAVNPQVQKTLQLEIDRINQEYKGKPPYEILLAMKYLDQVVCETLRLWPPGFLTDRLCIKDYVIEPKLPREKVVFVEKGISIVIPVIGLHRDPQYYHEPDRFDPERFNDENKAKIVPGTYLPFGVGPRNCIGSRFALLELKTLFFHLLSKYIIVPIEETQIPLKISPKRLNLAPEKGFKLGLHSRSITSY